MEDYWQSNIPGVEARLLKLFENELLTDVNFAIRQKDIEKEPKIICAHKLILASASPVFHAMFYGPMAEKTNKAIQVEEIDVSTFSTMLKYIYTNVVDLETWDDAAKLYNAAKMYLLNTLSESCISFMLKKLSKNNALKMFEFAKFCGECSLQEAALKMIKDETLCVIHTPDFYEIEMSTLMTILEQDNLHASEKELFEALENLAKAQKVELTDGKICFRTAVQQINFLCMSSEEFLDGPLFSDLLLPDEKVAILRCIVQPENGNNIYPKQFIQGIRKRPLLYFNVRLNNIDFGKVVIDLEKDVMPETIDHLNIIYENFECLHISFEPCVKIEFSKDCYIAGAKAYKLEAENFCLSSNPMSSNMPPFFSFHKINTCFIASEGENIIGQIIQGMDVILAMADYGIFNSALPRNIPEIQRRSYCFVVYCGFKCKNEKAS